MKLKPDHFDNVSIDHVFETNKKGLRISRVFSDFLSREHKIAIMCELNRAGETEYYWKRDYDTPLSKDSYLIDFVKSPFSWARKQQST